MTEAGENVRSRWSVPRCRATSPGVPALVEARVFEADREGPDVPRRLQLGQGGGDARRVDPAREEHPERDVGPPVTADRRPEVVPEPPRSLLERRGLARRFGRLPVSADGRPARLPRPACGPGELLHPAPDRVGAGHVFVEEVAGQARRGSSRRETSGWARSAFGSEPKTSRAGRGLGVVERLLAHPVAGQDQPSTGAVPDRQGEHPVELADEPRPEAPRRGGPGPRCRTRFRKVWPRARSPARSSGSL